MVLQESRERPHREGALRVVAGARCCDCGQPVDRPENPDGEYMLWRNRVRVCAACVRSDDDEEA